MSSLCNERKEFIEFGTKPAWARGEGKRREFFICEKCVDKIPRNARRENPCCIGAEGMHFFRMEGPETRSGGISCLPTEAGKFLFSLSAEDAKKYFPRTYAEIYARDSR